MLANGRHRLIATLVLALTAGGLLAVFPVGGEFATFNAETENAASAFAGGWIPAPTSLTVNGPAGYGADLTWVSGASASAPSPNPVAGQQLFGVDGGTGASASCGSSYGYLSTMTGATTTSYTDPGSSSENGHWYCYEMVSTSTGTWTASDTFSPVRVGLYVTGVHIANGGGGSNRMNNGDTITITFNQDIGTPTANRFCAVNSGSNDEIILGDTRTSGTCSTTDTYTIGKITGVTISASINPITESVGVSGNVLTVQLTANTTRTATGVAGSTFTPSTSVTSAVGGAAACTSASAPTCVGTADGTSSF
jgi:hypothetical protein